MAFASRHRSSSASPYRSASACCWISATAWWNRERRGCLLVNATTELAAVDPAVAMRAGEAFERVAAEFRSVLERGQHTAEIKADLDVRAAGRYLAHTLNGLRLLAKTTDRSAADEVVDITLTLFDLDWTVQNS